MSNTALILGAGLGGLLCGRVLSRAGWDVTLLEQEVHPGGALQSFMRGGVRFDTGFHSVGGLGPGEPLEKIFRPLGLMDLPWEQVPQDVLLDGATLPFLRLNGRWTEELEHVLEPFHLSIWRIRGGGQTLVDALAEGLTILCRKKVVSIEDHTVTCADGSSYRSDVIISDLHPRITFDMVKDPVRPAYRKRLARLQNGPGVFTVNALLVPGSVCWQGSSMYIGESVMLHFGEKDENGFARSLDLMAFVPEKEMTQEQRTQEAERLIAIARQFIPEIAIERYWTSTPATWERFTGTPDGSAFGILKNSRLDYLGVQTPLPWLFLTGQNPGLHGILGTSVTAMNTCNAILS